MQLKLKIEKREIWIHLGAGQCGGGFLTEGGGGGMGGGWIGKGGGQGGEGGGYPVWGGGAACGVREKGRETLGGVVG